jgi:hypothetical protein
MNRDRESKREIIIHIFGIVICFWTSISCLYAQSDSVSLGSTATDNTHFVIGLDSRSTIIEKRHININGALAGISFGKKSHTITLGYYWLGYNAANRLIDFHKNLAQSINLSYYTPTDVQFVSLAYWYPIIKNKKWTFSVPIEFGVGTESRQYRKLSNDHTLGNGYFSFEPYQIGTYTEYKLTPWVGLSTQLGYRNAISKGDFKKRFGGMYYSYGLTVYPGQVYNDVKLWYTKRK